jgi:hypothetical protein
MDTSDSEDVDGWTKQINATGVTQFIPARQPGPRLTLDQSKTALDFFQLYFTDTTIQ